MEGAHETDCLIDAGQRIPDWLHFFGMLKLQLGQVLNPGLVTRLSRSDPVLGLCFSLKQQHGKSGLSPVQRRA